MTIAGNGFTLLYSSALETQNDTLKGVILVLGIITVQTYCVSTLGQANELHEWKVIDWSCIVVNKPPSPQPKFLFQASQLYYWAIYCQELGQHSRSRLRIMRWCWRDNGRSIGDSVPSVGDSPDNVAETSNTVSDTSHTVARHLQHCWQCRDSRQCRRCRWHHQNCRRPCRSVAHITGSVADSSGSARFG